MMPKNLALSQQVPIFKNDLASYLILRGHLLDMQKPDFKCPKNWIYWFREDESIYKDMDIYINFRKEMCLIRDKAKMLDNLSKNEYNNNVENAKISLEENSDKGV